MMDYQNTNTKWEDVFIDETIELEEKMSSFDMDALSKSKLRLCLENKILDWKKYESWVLQNLGCSSLKEDVDVETLRAFSENAKQAQEIYSNYDFWNEDLIPISVWENQLIVFGLQYNEKLIAIENHIFILASTDVLNYFSSTLSDNDNPLAALEQIEKSLSKSISKIEGLSEDISSSPKIDFNQMSPEEKMELPDNLSFDSTESLPPLTTSSAPAPVSNTNNTVNIWDFITERHEEYCFEAKKQFNAYLVLKIEHSKTKIFKMDPDLKRKNINESLFEYSLNESNPFSRVAESGISESLNISELGLELLKFKFVCITPLRRGDKTEGFLLGFKLQNLSEQDQELLEDLARESAA